MAEEIDTTPTADRNAEWREVARAVYRISTVSMPPALREVVLGLLRGETPSETAARLRISPVTVRTRLLRARAILRKELEPYLGSSDDGVQERAG